MDPNLVSVRYMVDDVDAALAFYTTHLGFKPLTKAAPAFADVTRGNLRLLLSGGRAQLGVRCLMADSPDRAAGIVFISSSTISARKWSGFEVRASHSQ
jgi:catechol 2,3-dioxygenase-like lactoylglutathione lyase family enzyme